MTPEQFKEFADFLSEPSFLVNSKGEIVAANTAAAPLLGFESRKLQGQQLSDYLADPPEKLREYLRFCSRTSQRRMNSFSVRTANDGAQKVRVECAVMRPRSAASPALLLLQIKVKDPASGRFLELKKRINQLAIEIRQRRRAEQERDQLLLREQAARLEAETANRMKDEFLATLSHELRTPLNAIFGWARMLLAGNIDMQTVRHGVEVIERNAQLQIKLIDDILDVSRIITGNLRLDLSTVYPTQIVEAAVEVFRPAAEAKQIDLQLLLDPSAGPTSGDSARIQQIVWNLLSNALKFTPKQGRIQVRLERVDAQIKLTISDTGKGIDSTFLPYVFDRFRQADGSFTREQGGLGLGLAIVKQLVELHGGTVEAASPGQGQGATFTVWLPLIVDRDVDHIMTGYQILPQKTEAFPPFDAPPTLAGLRLLVVDDITDAQVLISTILGRSGAEVKVAGSAAEGFAAFQEWQPDMLISDIEMPFEDGYSLIRRIREASQEKKQIPAVALTAHAQIEDRVKALKAGFQAHIAKPVDPTELVTVIARLIATWKG